MGENEYGKSGHLSINFHSFEALKWEIHSKIHSI